MQPNKPAIIFLCVIRKGKIAVTYTATVTEALAAAK